MADYSVSTAEELMSAINSALSGGDTNTSIRLTADIDFNNSPYYNWNSDFLNVYSTISMYGWIITIDGDNHKLTNIYCKSDKSVLVLGINNGTINIKNLTIEAITTNGTVADIKFTTNFENVTFNIKAYNVDSRHLFNMPQAWRITFTNCIFNLYLTNTTNASMSLFFCYNRDSSYSNIFDEFYSCIFKLRNATDKIVYIFDMTTGLFGRDACYLENCAIFYNDVGSKTLDYESYTHKISSGDYPTLINTYIASFGTVNKKPMLTIHNENSDNPNHTVQSCFVDSDKIKPVVSSNILTPSSGTVGGVTALTTAQCKDRNKLSEIGYIFAEET